jgi:SAM-dependent methyltransferase
MKCRICAASEVTEIGQVEYYSGFSWSVFDCLSCGCRFTKHDESIYNWLHSQPASIYALYRDLADTCKDLFDQGNLSGLKRELSKDAKYKFVINALEGLSWSARLMEVGCGRGCLTSYFILSGCQIIGTDVSSEAILGAKTAFGDHFFSADSTAIQNGAPYDAIYHVGTIGCVSDPLHFTRDLLKLLKPGGQLLFNAPNAAACWLRGQLWLDAAPPPDLVTLFRRGFWHKHFDETADVTEQVEMCPADQSLEIGLRNALGRRWQDPKPLQLDASVDAYQHGRRENHHGQNHRWHWVERGSIMIGRATYLSYLAPKKPAPFGLFVKMIKKSSGIPDR